MHIQLLGAQYGNKPSQLTRSMFSTIPSILPNQQSTLSPSSLPTDMTIITPITTPSRYLTQSPSKKPSWFSKKCQMQIPSVNHHRALVQCTLCCKSLIQVERQVGFILNNQVVPRDTALKRFIEGIHRDGQYPQVLKGSQEPQIPKEVQDPSND